MDGAGELMATLAVIFLAAMVGFGLGYEAGVDATHERLRDESRRRRP